MSKREARSFAAAGVDVDAPRAKRRKEAPAASPDSKQNAQANHTDEDIQESEENAQPPAEDEEEVREKGLQLWQRVKDAVNKDGQIASFQFMRLPSRRQYPDYYAQIKSPIALDDIKSKLDSRAYTSMRDVMQDFETCFRNAKRYNMKESQIWKDAKFLHKYTMKEYSRITGINEGNGDGSDEEKKKKAPTAYRLLKSRLQKLVDKVDDTGRVLSTQFMHLPYRKEWPLYYTIIKRPQCFENVFKKLKRKEYPMPVDFANDVELIFSNALEFNQEHTQIWEDAVALREYFRKLMSDLPEPYTISAYANAGEHPTKIKLKMPHNPSAAAPITAPAPSLPSSNSIMVPGSHASSASRPPPTGKDNSKSGGPAAQPRSQASSATPVIPPTPVVPALSSSTAPRVPALAPTPPAPAVAPQAQKAHTTTLQPPHTASTNGGTLHPSSAYQQTPALASASSVSPIVPATVSPVATTTTPVTRPSPPAANVHTHPLRHVTITTMPHRRRLLLNHAAGVRTWAMRLNGNETGVIVSDVVFLSRHNQEEEESSGDEEPQQRNEEEEEEEEGEAPPVKKRGPGRPRKRTRASKSPKKSKGKSTAEAPPGPLQVTVNGTVIPDREDETWEIQVPYGLSILEVGEKNGSVWKVYVDRAAA